MPQPGRREHGTATTPFSTWPSVLLKLLLDWAVDLKAELVHPEQSRLCHSVRRGGAGDRI